MAISLKKILWRSGLILALGLAFALNPYGTKQASLAPASTATASTKSAQASSLHFVAHAGGRYQGKTYTNSIPALEASYRAGYRIEEVDINLTSDHQIVLLHDWNSTVQSVYGLPAGRRDFTTWATETSHSPFQPARLADLAQWISSRPDVQVILDTKTSSLDVLSRIAGRYPELRPQFIPYIYRLEDYASVAQLGFGNVSLLVVPGQYTPAQLLEFAHTHALHSIAMTPETLRLQDPALTDHVRVYCWTVNDPAVAQQVSQLHASGIITDDLRSQP